MKRTVKLISLILILLISVSVLCSCKSFSGSSSDDLPYITVGDKKVTKEYIGYFFYVAKLNMIKEAGMTLGEGGNSTQADVDAFWANTEIEGRTAVDVARDLAADNAVIQTVQYLKAVDEGIKLSADDEKEISAQISAAIQTSGGQTEFNNQLEQMDCNASAYRQILTENIYVQKLYDKYDFEGKLSVSDEEIKIYSQNHQNEISPEMMIDSAKKDKFNKMAQDWKKEYEVKINDNKMKEFTIK